MQATRGNSSRTGDSAGRFLGRPPVTEPHVGRDPTQRRLEGHALLDRGAEGAGERSHRVGVSRWRRGGRGSASTGASPRRMRRLAPASAAPTGPCARRPTGFDREDGGQPGAGRQHQQVHDVGQVVDDRRPGPAPGLEVAVPRDSRSRRGRAPARAPGAGAPSRPWRGPPRRPGLRRGVRLRAGRRDGRGSSGRRRGTGAPPRGQHQAGPPRDDGRAHHA